MMKKSVLTVALAAAFVAPAASAADDKELAAIREQIRQMKESYEARLQSLEQRLQEAQAAVAQAQNTAVAAQQAPAAAPEPAPAPAPAPAAANAFNPNISLVLAGTYQNLSQDPSRYRIQGFAPPGGEVGPGQRSFNLGESELTMMANIDPMFSGVLTFALGSEDTVGVEEGYFQTRSLGSGFNVRAGRFLSSLGYLNSIHAHAWDFVDAPLAYQAFFGGQYKTDGVQARWLAPTDTFIELGAEAGSGRSFPGSDRNKNGIGSSIVFAHVGDDIGDSGSWRAGLSYLHTGSANRGFDDNGVQNAFSGTSNMWVADAIYKWAPHGDPSRQNLKLQGEYLRRKESGTLAAGELAGPYASTQSGWYLQGVYQFMPYWRAGLRYDRLSSGTPQIGLVDNGQLGIGAFPALASYAPSRGTVMLDYSPSEFSRLRLQFARDKARPGAADNEIFLQYIMSLGTHAAHAF
ncbi:MAG: hypothetical protein ACJ8LG_09815 [Massilia sp.]